MKTWLISLSMCAVFCGLVSALTPIAWRKYTELAGILLFLAVSISPLRSLSGFDGMELLSAFEEQAESKINSEFAAELRASVLANYVNSKLAAQGISCSVSLSLSYSDSHFICTRAVACFQEALSEADTALALVLISENTGIAAEEIELCFEGGEFYQS